MRNLEPLFRGYSESDKSWIFGFYHEVEVEGIKHSYIFWQGNSTPVDIKSAGVWIGISDKNGNKIFTGMKAKVQIPLGGFWGKTPNVKEGVIEYDAERCRFVCRWEWSKNQHHIDIDCDLDIEITTNAYQL